ncbi:right-handed parallel beta-helix repeat-containing protein [Halorarum salinum]|uniref:Right-handed parallel beta-helix repeat-containing protein n=1 Tax=Halorarum salinum TaxID=2743089 RepID=A0A7D5LE05_9EURY|nr:right-handed parallel beta-helix repeat-containing protein [Halobaculum salinum]QLG63769.1 right-handed parallel beta-helix repeat-containing protein [Halobaculum salinum]
MSGRVRPAVGAGLLLVVILVAATAALVPPPGVDTSPSDEDGPPSDGTEPPPDADRGSETVRTISGCTTISEPGTYRLTRDIADADRGRNFTFISEACIRIEASDVRLDGDGHTVEGFGVSDTTAIRVAGSDELEDVTVADLSVTEWNRAVYVHDAANVTIRGVNSTGNTYGFFLEDARNGTIRDSTASTGFVGVYLDDAGSTTLANVTFGPNHADDVVREGGATRHPDESVDALARVGAVATPAVRSPPTRATPAVSPRGTRGRPTSP